MNCTKMGLRPVAYTKPPTEFAIDAEEWKGVNQEFKTGGK